MMTRLRFSRRAAVAAAMTLLAGPAAAGVLVVEVTGVRSGSGAVMARVVRPGSEPGGVRTVAETSRPAEAGAMSLSFENLVAGDYAVMLSHDENGNGAIDSNAFGIPTEGFAFSNRATANFGPPAFEAMKVRVAADGQASTTAEMTY